MHLADARSVDIHKCSKKIYGCLADSPPDAQVLSTPTPLFLIPLVCSGGEVWRKDMLLVDNLSKACFF